MPTLIISHRVKSYDQWRIAFEAHRPARQKAGLTDRRLWRSIDDPDRITILMDAEDVGRARAFAESEDLKNIMREAGVVSEPVASFLEELPIGAPVQPSASATQAPRA